MRKLKGSQRPSRSVNCVIHYNYECPVVLMIEFYRVYVGGTIPYTRVWISELVLVSPSSFFHIYFRSSPLPTIYVDYTFRIRLFASCSTQTKD